MKAMGGLEAFHPACRTLIKFLVLVKLKLLGPRTEKLDSGERQHKVKIVALPGGLITDPAAMQFYDMPDKGESVTGPGLAETVYPAESFRI